MNARVRSAAAIPLEGCEFKRGFVNGLNSPSMSFVVSASYGETAKRFAESIDIFERCSKWNDFEHPDIDLAKLAIEQSDFVDPVAQFLISSAIWLQSLSGVPSLSHGTSVIAQERLFVLVPTQEAFSSRLRDLFQALISILNKEISSDCPKNDFERLEKICRIIQKDAKRIPPNTANFLCAARKLGIPSFHKIANFIVFGQGKNSITLNSSLSATESYFGTAVAKDKIASSVLLRQLGLPVAEQVKVSSLSDALSEAERIGFPVVIKPADLDGGYGVFPGLQDSDAVVKAWQQARTKSANILLEKHVEGFDYRILVAKGEVIAAVERKPAHVVGDGSSTVLELLTAENEKRIPSDGRIALLLPLPSDDEAKMVLSSQGFTLHHVPAPGQTVYLRVASNHAQGGTVAWCLDRVHPENSKLALNVARSFSLEVAGIDFITTDISRPWWEVPSAICEVNAQPSVGRPTHHRLFERLLSKFLSDGSTIPQVAIVGEPQALQPSMRMIELEMTRRGYKVGSARREGAYLGGQLIGRHESLFDSHRNVLMDPEATLALVGVGSVEDLKSGLASPRLDFVVPVAGERSVLASHLAKRFGGKIVELETVLASES